MKTRTLHRLLLAAILVGMTTLQAKPEQAAIQVDDVIWANGEIYSTILTGNSFKMPPAHSVDILFNFDMSGLSGQRPISDAAPGDRHYNGGRWSVQFVIFTDAGKMAHDPDMDGVVNFELTSAEMVDHHVQLGHIEIVPTSIYFACPLVKSGQS